MSSSTETRPGTTITVNRAELGNAVAFAALGLTKRPVLPVMGGMKVTASGGTLEFAAFDYEVSAQAKVTGYGDDGSVSLLVTGSELAAAVKTLPKGRNVTAGVTLTDAAMVITCDGTETTLTSMGAEAAVEYPQLPAMPETSGLVDAEMFARSVARVAVCATTENTLPVLMCVSMTSDNGSLELAATDRYRLALDRVQWSGPDNVTALVPATTLAKFAAKAAKTGEVTIHLGDGFAGFSDGTYSLTIRTCTGDFPNYLRLIRNDSKNMSTVTADAAALGAAVTRAGKLSERGTPVRLDVAGENITVHAMRDGDVAGTQSIPATLEGTPVKAGLNPVYLASVLGGIKGTAGISFIDAVKPVKITSSDGFTALVVPIRLEDKE